MASHQSCSCTIRCFRPQNLSESRYAGPLTSAQPKQQRDADTVLAASLAAEQAAAAKRAGGGADPFADLGVSFVEARVVCATVMFQSTKLMMRGRQPWRQPCTSAFGVPCNTPCAQIHIEAKLTSAIASFAVVPGPRHCRRDAAVQVGYQLNY